LVLTTFTLLIPAFALLFAPPVLTVWLLRFRTLPYHTHPSMGIHGFGRMLEPRYVLGARALDQ
jgi:hypothetical protein